MPSQRGSCAVRLPLCRRRWWRMSQQSGYLRVACQKRAPHGVAAKQFPPPVSRYSCALRPRQSNAANPPDTIFPISARQLGAPACIPAWWRWSAGWVVVLYAAVRATGLGWVGLCLAARHFLWCCRCRGKSGFCYRRASSMRPSVPFAN